MNNPFEELKDILLKIEGLLKDSLSKELSASISKINDKPITQKELCAYLGVTQQTVIRWKKKKKIPFFTIGTAIRFDLQDVLKSLGK